MKSIFICIFIFLSSCLVAQTQTFNKKNILELSIGQGFIDGLIRSPTPTIGIGYERKLNKYFSVYARLHTFYRRGRDIENFTVLGTPSIGSIEPESQSQFITQDDIDAHINLGLKDQDDLNTFKAFSVPLVFGIKITPLRYKNNALNLYAGLLIMYENRTNTSVEYLVGQADITLISGEIITSEFTLISEIYHRHIVAAESLGIGYEYQFEKLGLELYFGENNLFGPANASTVWDLSLKLKLKL